MPRSKEGLEDRIFATKAQRHEETQSGGICHEGTKTRRHKEEMINTKAIYYNIINLVPLSAFVPSWQKNSWQKTFLQKLCGQTFII